MCQQQADIKKEIKQDWQSDLARYPSRPWSKEVSIIAIAWYRHGLHVDNMSESIWKRVSLKIYWFIFYIIEILTGISLPKTVKVGRGLRIHHFGNIFIHKNAVIGKTAPFVRE